MSTPPPLPLHVRTAAERTILIVAGSAAAGAGLLFLVAGLLRPAAAPCGWKSLTGWPCAGCGGTRVLFSLAAGNWSEALCMNPGAVFGVVGLAVAAVYAAVVLVFRLPPWRPRVPAWRWVVGAAFVLNWVYLVWAGRV